MCVPACLEKLAVKNVSSGTHRVEVFFLVPDSWDGTVDETCTMQCPIRPCSCTPQDDTVNANDNAKNVAGVRAETIRTRKRQLLTTHWLWIISIGLLIYLFVCLFHIYTCSFSLNVYFVSNSQTLYRHNSVSETRKNKFFTYE